MAHLLAPKSLDPELPVFFNVDGHVGAPPSENKPEDVLLVQFSFQIIARTERMKIWPEVKIAAQPVSTTGMMDPPTLNAIKVFQVRAKKKYPYMTVDGRVSPAQGYFYGHKAVWLIVFFNDIIQDLHVELWPRLDRVPGCPFPLQAMVKREVIGVSRFTRVTDG